MPPAGSRRAARGARISETRLLVRALARYSECAISLGLNPCQAVALGARL